MTILQELSKIIGAEDEFWETELSSVIDLELKTMETFGAPEGDQSMTFAEWSDDVMLVQFAKEALRVALRLRFDPPTNAKQIEYLDKYLNDIHDKIYMICLGE